MLEDLPIDPSELKMAPELRGLSYLAMFRYIALEAAKRGILVLMACHRLAPAAWPGKGLWFDDESGMDEERVMLSWDRLSEALCDVSRISPPGDRTRLERPQPTNRSLHELRASVQLQLHRMLWLYAHPGYTDPG